MVNADDSSYCWNRYDAGSILLLADLHLEECIKQVQLGNTEDALDHCQLADQELEVVMKNITVNR
jgi:hypothetical protein